MPSESVIQLRFDEAGRVTAQVCAGGHSAVEPRFQALGVDIYVNGGDVYGSTVLAVLLSIFQKGGVVVANYRANAERGEIGVIDLVDKGETFNHAGSPEGVLHSMDFDAAVDGFAKMLGVAPDAKPKDGFANDDPCQAC